MTCTATRHAALLLLLHMQGLMSFTSRRLPGRIF
jgi:hypothetical protein